MIYLFTDFGVTGPYVGQLKSVLTESAPNTPIIDLMHDAPRFNPQLASYLLAALARSFTKNSVVLGVVDPGVGSASREPIVARIEGRWYVGPGNGLFDAIAAQSQTQLEDRYWTITWRPEQLSRSFHGRDLFAPIAAKLAKGETPLWQPLDRPCHAGTAAQLDLPKIIYIDAFGNAITGMRAKCMTRCDTIQVNGYRISRASVFADVPVGESFFYENSHGLIEVAVNQGRADEAFQLCIGDDLTI